VAEGEKTRLVAWSRELHAVHQRLREALRVAREAVDEGRSGAPGTRDLLLYCRGFCAALTGHHEGEDRVLFPAIAEQYPHLRETVRQLAQDHSTIAHLLTGLQVTADRSAPAAELERHLDGIAAIMESHFRYEERALLLVLETLALDADPQDVLGPL